MAEPAADCAVASGQQEAEQQAEQHPRGRPVPGGRAGLVQGRKSGREVRYLVRPDALEHTARRMVRVAADWARRLAAIMRIAESEDPL